MENEFNRSPVHLLHRATQLTDDLFDEVLKGSDLTPRQVFIMLAIARSAGISQTMISRATGVDRSTLTDVVSRLVRKGLVRRQRARSDARRYSLTLTKQGEELLGNAMPLLEEVDRRFLSSLPETESGEFMRLLGKAVLQVRAPMAKAS